MKTFLMQMAISVLFVAGAKADCSFSSIPRVPARWPAAETQKSAMRSQAKKTDQNQQAFTIIGLWKVSFVSDGQVVDEGFDQWNNGGTEILNDTPPPATGNVCLGVWEKTGPATYKLKHPSWTFDNAGNLTGTAIIREEVTLDNSGDVFKGPFTVDVYDMSGTLLFHLDGQITGERITVD